MSTAVKDGMDVGKLAALVEQLEISKLAIARRYGCSAQFVYAVFARRQPCPDKLAAVIEEMIEGRRHQLRLALRATRRG